MNNPANVPLVLIGMMGSGKTTCGRTDLHVRICSYGTKKAAVVASAAMLIVFIQTLCLFTTQDTEKQKLHTELYVT